MTVKSKIEFRLAQWFDWEAVATLLEESGLPLEGAQEHFSNFITAWRDSDLLGCAGLEIYGQTGLLRSVAVKESERGTGLGQELTRQVLQHSQVNQIKRVILLTETAQNFFPKFGFTVIERTKVPSEALVSVEFTTACPESATVMRLDL